MKHAFLIVLTAWILLTPAATVLAAEHDHHHDVVIGLTDVAGGQQITLIEDHALEQIELAYSGAMGLYYGGQACWIPADGALHLIGPTLPENHYQLELVPVEMPQAVLAFEDFGQILNGTHYALDNWQWSADEGWHFHHHINWALDPARVSPGQTVVAAFKLIDRTGQYLDSDTFDVTLTAVPEPATLVLLGFGAFMARRQRSRQG